MDISPYELITPAIIHNALSNNGFVSSGNLIVLKPDKQEFDEMISVLYNLQPFGFNCSSGCDEQSICYYQSIIKKRNWTCLKQPYNVIPWKLKETLLLSNIQKLKQSTLINGSEELHYKPYVIHFNMTPKPWETNRNKWIDNEIWWAYAMSIPNIKQICLSFESFSAKIIQFDFNLGYCPYCYVLYNNNILHNLFDCRNLYLRQMVL
jgi:hypothetical protein